MEESKYIKALYLQNLDRVTRHIELNKGTREDAIDIFQEAVLVFYEKVKKGEFRGDSSIATFIYAVAQNLWLSKLKKRKRALHHTYVVDSNIQAENNPELAVLDQEKGRLIMAVLNRVGASCKKILLYAVYYQYSMQEIAAKMGYKNEQIAKNKKYKCKKRFKQLLLADPVYQELYGD